MIGILKQMMRERFNLLMIACPLALLPFILTTFSSSPPVFGIQRTSVADSRVVKLTDPAAVDRMLQLKGSLIARSHDNAVTDLVFTVTNTEGSQPINLAASPFTISYHDQHQRFTNLPWTWRFQGQNNGDKLLQSGELLQLSIPLSAIPQVTLGSNTAFVVEITPPQGAILSIQRTTPANLAPIIDLDS